MAPLKLFYLVNDAAAQQVETLPEVDSEQPISDGHQTEGKRKRLEKSGKPAKKARIEHDDDADDEAENTAENDDKDADNADVSAESSDTVIYGDQTQDIDLEHDSDRAEVTTKDTKSCDTTTTDTCDSGKPRDDSCKPRDSGVKTNTDLERATKDKMAVGSVNQATSPQSNSQSSQSAGKSEAVTSLSQVKGQGNNDVDNMDDTMEDLHASPPDGRNIFAIMSKVQELEPMLVQSSSEANTCAPAQSNSSSHIPLSSPKPTTSVKPLPLTKASSQKTVLSPKKPGSLPPITINKRWIPNQVPVPKARPIAQKPSSSPPSTSGSMSPGRSPTAKQGMTPADPGSPGRSKLLLKGGKMGVSASLANTIGRTSSVNQSPAIIKDKPPRSSPPGIPLPDEGKKEGRTGEGKAQPGGKTRVKPQTTPAKSCAVPLRPTLSGSRSPVTISKALLSSKPPTPVRRVAPKPPTSRVAPTSRPGYGAPPMNPAPLRPPASPVNQAVVIPSGLKTFTVRPAGGIANGFTTSGSVQLIAPGGGLPPGPLTQIRFSGPLPGGKVPTTMVLTGSQMATLVGPGMGTLRGPRTLVPRTLSPATSPTSPSKVLNNSLPTGLSAVIDKLQYRSAKTLTFQPATSQHNHTAHALNKQNPNTVTGTQAVSRSSNEGHGPATVKEGGKPDPITSVMTTVTTATNTNTQADPGFTTIATIPVNMPTAPVTKEAVKGPDIVEAPEAGQGRDTSKLDMVEIQNTPGTPTGGATRPSPPLTAPPTGQGQVTTSSPCMVVVSSIKTPAEATPVTMTTDVTIPAKCASMEQTTISVVEQTRTSGSGDCVNNNNNSGVVNNKQCDSDVYSESSTGMVGEGCSDTYPGTPCTRTGEPRVYPSDTGLIMLANVAGAAREERALPSTLTAPPTPLPVHTAPSITPSVTPVPPSGAPSGVPSVSVAPVVSKTSVETQTTDSLDEGLRRVPASLSSANHTPPPVSRERTSPIIPSASTPSVGVPSTEQEPPIKRLKMMCHGIEAERKEQPRPGQGQRRTQPRQYVNGNGVTIGGRVSDPRNITPPGGDKRFSPPVSRHQYPPILQRPPVPVPMENKGTYVQPLMRMLSPSNVIPPPSNVIPPHGNVIHPPSNVIHSPSNVIPPPGNYFNMAAPVPLPTTPGRLGNHVPIADVVTSLPINNVGRQVSSVRHGVARPMPNHNNNKDLPPVVNQLPSDPLANGYDAPLELTTKKSRDRKKSEEDMTKSGHKASPIVVPNVLRS